MKCKSNFLFVDTSSISYISCVRPFENFLFELSCTLSEYPSLSVIHTPGRVLSAPDLLTRQLNDVILERNDTNLSKEQAYILPNLTTHCTTVPGFESNTVPECYDVHEIFKRERIYCGQPS